MTWVGTGKNYHSWNLKCLNSTTDVNLEKTCCMSASFMEWMSLVTAWEFLIAGLVQTMSLSKAAVVIRTRHGQAVEELVQDHRTGCTCSKTRSLFVVGDLISRSRKL